MALNLRIPLQPKQELFLQSIEQYPITFFGGAKGGGKSYALRNLLLARRFEKPNTSAAIFRKTYPELEANHIRPLFQQHPELKAYWSEGRKLLTLANGSTLQFCHCASEADVDLYQGREFHDLGIDEAGQWTEAMFRKLLGSNRSSRQGIKPRAILTGNPGGPGHQWLKRLFIEKRYNDRERAEDYSFIQALVDDNPALIDNDPDYVARLEAEPNEALRKAYRYGSWDVFAGQYFSELDRKTHFIQPFDIPVHWNRFGAYDYGFNHPAAFAWLSVDEDGTVYQYRELVQAGLRVDQFFQRVRSYSDTNDLMYIEAGWDCWAKKGTLESGTSPTIAEEVQKHGIVLRKAKIDRLQGASQLRNYLALRQCSTGNKPRLYIFNNCPITFDTLSRMEHDPNRVEDVLKVDATEGDPLSGDDAYDCLRYALMSRPSISEPAKVNYIPGTKEYSDHFSQELERNVIDKMKQQKENSMNPTINWNIGSDMIPDWNKWD
jgi:phage terminase large subunit